MIESPHPVERTLGMEYYTTDSLGIGGMLRRQAEDFMVEELSLPVEGPGPYLVCRLTKKNWELLHLLKEIARALGISHRRISWAGTKDRHAVTTQLIAIYDVDPAMVERLSIKDVRLEVVGSSKVPLSLGMLQGNRFSLWLRECRGEELKSRVESGVGEARKGLLNYYGVQRFGARRPVTHLVGEQILFGDYESAVLTYVGRSFPDEPESARLAREEFHRTRDAGAALKNFPLHLAYERSILHHLVTNPTGFRKALAVLPPKLLSMFVSAYQSYLFNSALSARCREGTPLTTPVKGDVLVFSDGRTDRVTPRLLPAAQLQLERRRACLGLFIPG
ncbi:MAG: tRNA pseudouridine(13) synthase TruD, partial [Methanomicrobiales archaeon]|nr:tRNA pseudouridine(13) synthase TruD [Methanomicrobiales archaeon]